MAHFVLPAQPVITSLISPFRHTVLVCRRAVVPCVVVVECLSSPLDSPLTVAPPRRMPPTSVLYRCVVWSRAPLDACTAVSVFLSTHLPSYSLFQTDLVSAILSNDEHLIDSVFREGADVNRTDDGGCTPLHYAAFIGNIKVINDLLERGASVTAKDSRGVTPLHRAAQKDHADAVNLLIQRGASPLDVCLIGQSALHTAAMYESHSAATQLIHHHKSLVALRDNVGCSPLHVAASFAHPICAAILIDAQTDVTCTDSMGRTAMHCAAAAGCEKVLRQLRSAERGSREEGGGESNLVEKTDHQLRLPIHHAAIAGKAHVMDWLMCESRNSMNAKDDRGYTPLHLAVDSGSVKTVLALVEVGAEVSCASEDGTTSLHMAASTCENGRAMEVIIDHSPEEVLGQRRLDGFTALHCAAEWGRTNRIDCLLAHGVDVDPLAANKATPLHCASLAGHDMAAKHLLQAGADKHKRMDGGMTPLHLACQQAFLAVVKCLLHEGADPNARDDQARTPLHMAAHSDAQHASFVVDELMGANADVDARDSSGATPLHLAAKLANSTNVEKLIRRGASCVAADADGRTPLHYAVLQHNNSRAIQMLCRADSECVSRKDRDGFLPLHYAAFKGDAQLGHSLIEMMGVHSVPSSGAPLHLSPFHIAAARNHHRMIADMLQLFKKRVSLLEQDSGGRKRSRQVELVGCETDHLGRIPLHYAMAAGHVESVDVLLSGREGSAGHEDHAFCTPIHAAAMAGKHTCIKRAVQVIDGVVNVRDKMKRSLGMLCVTGNCMSEAVLSLSHLHQVDRNGRGYLHRAVAMNNRDLVEILLCGEKPCDVNIADKFGVTALHVAAALGKNDIVLLLLEKNADPQAKDVQNLTAADWAALHGNNCVLSILVGECDSTDSGDSALGGELSPSGKQSKAEHEAGRPAVVTGMALILAAEAGNHETVLLLLKRCPRLLHSQDDRGRTALHAAANTGRVDCLESLLGAGAVMDCVDDNGMTPLMLALRYPVACHTAEFLLERDSSLELRNADGDSAVHVCLRAGNVEGAKAVTDYMKQLCEHGNSADARRIVNQKNGQDETPLHLAVRNGMFDFIFALHGLVDESLETRDANGVIPLFAGVSDLDVMSAMELVLGLMEATWVFEPPKDDGETTTEGDVSRDRDSVPSSRRESMRSEAGSKRISDVCQRRSIRLSDSVPQPEQDQQEF